MAFIEIDWQPTKQHLRGFATACVIVFGALGAWAMWRHTMFGGSLGPDAARRVALSLWALAVACAVLRFLAPTCLRPLYVGLMAVSLPVGVVMSYVLGGVVFFGVVTPTALMFRLTGRDPMQRKFDRDAPTYWIRRSPVVDVARYYRQF